MRVPVGVAPRNSIGIQPRHHRGEVLNSKSEMDVNWHLHRLGAAADQMKFERPRLQPPYGADASCCLHRLQSEISRVESHAPIKVGDVTATIFQMTGHTPGSIGMVVPVKYQGRQHPILLVTAGTDVHNREAFVGGYEHIWDEAIKMRAEAVYQSHPNTNMNLLARTKYVDANYPPAKNPLLYGAARTERDINIMRNCTLARMDILGW